MQLPLNLALAAALTSSGSDAVECPEQKACPPKDISHLDNLRPYVVDLARYWELMDAREEKFLFHKPEEFPGDLSLLQKRFTDLQDAPPLSDCMKFPDRALVNDLLSFNRNYKSFVEEGEAMEMRHVWERMEVIREVDKLYQIWDLVRDARCEYYYVTVRRQSLKKLKEAIGEEAYHNGVLPPHVPVWRFYQRN